MIKIIIFLFEGEAKDIFRDTGGLQSVLDTVTSTRYGEVTKAGLYCLGSAVERNGNLILWGIDRYIYKGANSVKYFASFVR